jgi:hypothetical protein
VSWSDNDGGALEDVRSIDRRKARPGFLAQSFAVIKARAARAAARRRGSRRLAPLAAAGGANAPPAAAAAARANASPHLGAACARVLAARRGVHWRLTRCRRAAAAVTAPQDEFLCSFGRGGAREGDAGEGDAGADTQAEKALFEARENTVINVERVREMAATLP